MRSVLSGSGCSAADVAGVALPAEAWNLSSSATGSPSPRIEFERSLAGEQISLAKQQEFRSDLSQDLARLERWAEDQNWPASPGREIRVVVSDRFKISKSLVPA